MDGSGSKLVVTRAGASTSASARASRVAVLVRSSPTSLRLATIDADGREQALSTDLPVGDAGHPASYRLAWSEGGSGTVAAPFGARRVFATFDQGGCRLSEGEPIPGQEEVYEWTARLHHGRGLTVQGAKGLYTWTPGERWRARRVDGSSLGSVSLDEHGQALGFLGPALRSSLPICTVTRWSEQTTAPVAYRLPWYDWARLKLHGCEEPCEFDAGGPLSIAVADSEWFFDSNAAYVIVLDARGGSRAIYRRGFALSVVRRRPSGGALIVGTSGEMLDVDPGGHCRWLPNRLRRHLRAFGGELAAASDDLLVFGADRQDAQIVVCMGLYSRGLETLVAEAIVESPDDGQTWSLRALRSADPRVPCGRWCDVTFAT